MKKINREKKVKNYLSIAVSSCNVSYVTEITHEALFDVVATGKINPGYAANIICFLEELPSEVVFGVVHLAAQKTSRPIEEIWQNISNLCEHWNTFRTVQEIKEQEIFRLKSLGLREGEWTYIIPIKE